MSRVDPFDEARRDGELPCQQGPKLELFYLQRPNAALFVCSGCRWQWPCAVEADEQERSSVLTSGRILRFGVRGCLTPKERAELFGAFVDRDSDVSA